ncbi:VOC family protein [Bacillus sp. S/N-304-OC-R1]|uniref:VOC family protein n=1 Tax=Bacillus sp. S/N-304-OC-R1 TaxID=2758034 RepID=UPI001C8DD2AD|nr:VOC family protein [Bacillus sp. S/N-304-OC-R1]MBY0123746.1 VOC family protein [Bacillus sp. S/N-304-OC-R1]
MKWHHAGILVQNIDEAISFYEDIFEFKAEQCLTLPGEKIMFLKKGDVRIELIEPEEEFQRFSSIHLSWQVKGVGDWIEKLEKYGYLPSEGPLELDNGWTTVFFEGPNQEVIELIEISR